MESILSAASELIGTRLSDPIELGGSERSSVLRCTSAAGGTVVVKGYPDEPAGRRGFAAEAAGLSLRLAGPELLAADGERLLLVMEDLGDSPSLADALLGDDSRAAADGLLVWARTLGTVATESVWRRDDLAALWTQYSPGTMLWDCERWMARCSATLLIALGSAGLAAPPELLKELAEELTGIGHDLLDAFPAFTPGDTCLDNNLLTPQGLRLIDFESACFTSVFVTAAYCRMPFPSCWCVYRFPAELAAEVEAEFRRHVVVAYPTLADDALWETGMRRAVAAWTVDLTTWMLPRAAEDESMNPTIQLAPMARQVLRYRWETASALAEFPALAELMRLLLRDIAVAWDDPPLPEYPALRAVPPPQ